MKNKTTRRSILVIAALALLLIPTRGEAPTLHGFALVWDIDSPACVMPNIQEDIYYAVVRRRQVGFPDWIEDNVGQDSDIFFLVEDGVWMEAQVSFHDIFGNLMGEGPVREFKSETSAFRKIVLAHTVEAPPGGDYVYVPAANEGIVEWSADGDDWEFDHWAISGDWNFIGGGYRVTRWVP